MHYFLVAEKGVKVMPCLQAVVLVCDLVNLTVFFYCLPWHVSEAGGVFNNKEEIIKNHVSVVR